MCGGDHSAPCWSHGSGSSSHIEASVSNAIPKTHLTVPRLKSQSA